MLHTINVKECTLPWERPKVQLWTWESERFAACEHWEVAESLSEIQREAGAPGVGERAVHVCFVDSHVPQLSQVPFFSFTSCFLRRKSHACSNNMLCSSNHRSCSNCSSVYQVHRKMNLHFQARVIAELMEYSRVKLV